MSKQEVAKKSKAEVTVINYIQNGIEESIKEGLNVPKGYDTNTAIQGAYLKINELKDRHGKPALQVVGQTSLLSAVRSMVLSGLYPDKTQGYFIVRGTQLTFMPSYFGVQMMLKRDAGVKDVFAQVVLKGDELQTEIRNGEEYIVEGSHKRQRVWDASPTITREKIMGAYAIAKFNDGSERHQIMDKNQIEKAWSKSSSTQQQVHNDFPEQMALRSVINRLAKKILNTSVDADIRALGQVLMDADEIDGVDEIYTTPENAYKVSITPDNDFEEAEFTEKEVEELGDIAPEFSGEIPEPKTKAVEEVSNDVPSFMEE